MKAYRFIVSLFLCSDYALYIGKEKIRCKIESNEVRSNAEFKRPDQKEFIITLIKIKSKSKGFGRERR